MTTNPVLAGRLEDGSAAYARKDFYSAMKSWRSVAEAGNPEAQDRIGLLYTNGEGVTQDQSIAAEWYRKAAEKGNADAQRGGQGNSDRGLSGESA